MSAPVSVMLLVVPLVGAGAGVVKVVVMAAEVWPAAQEVVRLTV